MGYGYTQSAGKTLEYISDAYHAKGDASSNTITLNGGLWGFYEVTTRDQADGGISGSVHRSLTEKEKEYWKARGLKVSDTAVIKAGSFKISGSGKVVRFAGLPVKEINRAIGYA